MEIVQGGYTIRKMVAGDGGGSKGDVAVVNLSNKAVKAATGPNAGTVLGLFLEDVAKNGIALIAVPDKNAIIRAPYIGTNKSFLADSDLGMVFDLKDEKSINLDDTTDAVCICQSYDNENKTIDFVFTQAATYW